MFKGEKEKNGTLNTNKDDRKVKQAGAELCQAQHSLG